MPRLAYLHRWLLDFGTPRIIGVQQGFGVHHPLPPGFQSAHENSTPDSAGDSPEDLDRSFVFPASLVPASPVPDRAFGDGADAFRVEPAYPHRLVPNKQRHPCLSANLVGVPNLPAAYSGLPDCKT